MQARQVVGETITRQPRATIISNELYNTIFLLLFLVYPGAIAKLFSAFQCIPLAESGESFLRVDLSIECSSTQHRILLYAYALPVTFIYTFGVPMLFAEALWRHRHTLRRWSALERRADACLIAGVRPSSEVRAFDGEPTDLEELRWRAHHDDKLHPSVRRITAGYELKYYWFELFEMGRKLALVGVSCLFVPGSLSQVSYGLFTCFISFGAYMLCSPYEDNHDSILAQMCQVTLFCFLVASIILQFHTDEATRSFIDPILIGFNIMPLVTAVYLETPLPAKINRVLASCADGVQANALALRSSVSDRVSERRSRASRVSAALGDDRGSRAKPEGSGRRGRISVFARAAKMVDGAAKLRTMPPSLRRRRTDDRSSDGGVDAPMGCDDGQVTPSELGAVGRRGALKCTMPALSSLSSLSTTMAWQSKTREEQIEQRKREHAEQVAQQLERRRARDILRGLNPERVSVTEQKAVPVAARLPAPGRCGQTHRLDRGLPRGDAGGSHHHHPGAYGGDGAAARLAAIRARAPLDRSGAPGSAMSRKSGGRRGSCLAERTMAASVERPGRQRQKAPSAAPAAAQPQLQASPLCGDGRGGALAGFEQRPLMSFDLPPEPHGKHQPPAPPPPPRDSSFSPPHLFTRVTFADSARHSDSSRSSGKGNRSSGHHSPSSPHSPSRSPSPGQQVIERVFERVSERRIVPLEEEQTLTDFSLPPAEFRSPPARASVTRRSVLSDAVGCSNRRQRRDSERFRI
jgi:hypothetical protein